MIQLFAKRGNHNKLDGFRSDAEVKRAFERNGIDYDALVERCRDPEQKVPFFENLLGSTWVVSEGATASRVDLSTGAEDTKVTGPGLFAPDGYWTLYEAAHDALQRAEEKTSISDLLNALVSGVASVEAFLNGRVHDWNKRHPEDRLIDSRQAKVSLDDKIDRWIPKMAAGRKIDKSNARWRDFKTIRSVRDDEAIHLKTPGHSVTLAEFVDLVNKFRSGIAGILVDLHVLFEHRIPRVVIRDAFSPEAVLLTDNAQLDDKKQKGARATSSVSGTSPRRGARSGPGVVSGSPSSEEIDDVWM